MDLTNTLDDIVRNSDKIPLESKQKDEQNMCIDVTQTDFCNLGNSKPKGLIDSNEAEPVLKSFIHAAADAGCSEERNTSKSSIDSDESVWYDSDTEETSVAIPQSTDGTDHSQTGSGPSTKTVVKNTFRDKEKDRVIWEDNLMNVPQHLSMEFWIMTLAPGNIDTIHLIWVQEVSVDVARLTMAYNNNFLLIARNYEPLHWIRLPFPVSVKLVKVENENNHDTLRCFSFGDSPVDYFGDQKVYDSYGSMESQVQNIAKLHNMHVAHIADLGWKKDLDGNLKNIIIYPSC